jgi:hypothetical protein
MNDNRATTPSGGRVPVRARRRVRGLPRAALATLIYAAGAAAPVLATTADDLCPPLADPCIVVGTHGIDGGSVIDVGSREIRVAGRLDVGPGTMTLRARRIVLEGMLLARGSTTLAGGTIIAAADTILIDGTIDATGARGGTVELTARGELAVRAGIVADASRPEGTGGSIALGAGELVVNAVVAARGGKDGFGGAIVALASGGATIAGQLDASGGDGGIVDVSAGGGPSGDLTVSVGTRILAEPLCRGCDGGAITLFAGGPNNPAAAIAVDGQLRAKGLDGNRDEVGGSGGTISIISTGDVRAGPFTVFSVPGGGPDGFGGEVAMTAGGAIRVGGEIDVGANGRESFGGTVEIQAGGDVEMSGKVRTRGYIGGDVEIIAGGASLAITDGAEIDTRPNTSATGGDVTLVSDGDLSVDGTVRSDGGSGPEGAGGRHDLSGCVVRVGPKGVLRSRGAGGTNVITSRLSLIVAGTLLADRNAGRNELRFPSQDLRPIYIEGAVIDPPAEEVVDGTLRPCRPTRPPVPTSTMTVTSTVTSTVTPTPQATPTATPTGSCPGDCNGDRVVTVDEVVLGTNIGLDLQPLARCPPIDHDSDGRVMVNDLVAAVLAGLEGCG